MFSFLVKTVVLCFLCVAGLTQSAAAASLEMEPFDSINQSPLVSIFGLPGPGNYLLMAPGRTEVGFNAVLSNNYTTNDSAREALVLDGETTRFTLMARHGLTPHVEVGVRIPYVSQGGGFLDGFIENYHSTFGFPNGGREQAPRNRLLYLYRRDGIDRVRVDNSGSGVGDLALTAAWQLLQQSRDEGQEGLVVNMSLKLPTGDSDQLQGSGSKDIALWLTGGSEGKFALGNWTSYGAAGMLFMTDGKVLPDQQNSWAGFGSLGVAWQPRSWLSLKLQADAHTPLFRDSELKEISANSVQLIAGGTLYLWEKTSLDIGLGEDLIVNTAPDVTFYFTLRNRF